MSETTDAGQGGVNPFAAPRDEAQLARPAPAELVLASGGQRFCTALIDYVGILVGNGALQAGLEAIGLHSTWVGSVIGLGLGFAYYATFEAAFGRTLGKILVGTRVVDSAGHLPTFGQILGRTACRYVPFEAISFFGQPAVGWHDRWSNTRVIRTRD
jgi:uncharacterized RDD family membrane protein YckC